MSMKTKTITIRRREVRETKWFGLNEASRRLGVNRAHLSRVLTGERESAKLLGKMKELGIEVIDETVVE